MITETTFISSLCIPDDLVDDETVYARPASFTAQQQKSKHFGLILSIGILLSSHLQVLPLISSKQNLLYVITLSTLTCACVSKIIFLFIFKRETVIIDTINLLSHLHSTSYHTTISTGHSVQHFKVQSM